MKTTTSTRLPRRDFLKTCVAAGLGAVAMPNIGRLQAEKSKPNILFIMTDQQHWKMMSCTGTSHVKTPNLDALAASGIRFDHAFCANPLCVPSRFSLQTGLMPSAMDLWDNDFYNERVTDAMIAQSLGPLLRGAGYSTVYGGKTHLPFSFERCGYQYFEKDARRKLVDSSANFLRQKPDKPFFAFLSFINPHDIAFKAYGEYYSKAREYLDWKVMNSFLEQVPTDPKEREAWVEAHCPPLTSNFEIPQREPDAINQNSDHYGVARARSTYSPTEWRIYRWLYARLTERVDEEIGIVLSALDDAKLNENTLVIFTSDHGDMDSCHRLTQKWVLYEQSVRIPFIMSYPGHIKPGQVDRTHFISNGLDLLPTVCDYAGIKPPANCMGRSVRSIAENQPVSDWRPYIVSQTSYGHGHMVHSGTHKYCVYPMEGARITEQFTDLTADPGEMNNLVGKPEAASLIEKHKALLEVWKHNMTGKS